MIWTTVGSWGKVGKLLVMVTHTVFEATHLHVTRSGFGNRRAGLWLFPREELSVTEGEQCHS